MDQPATSPQTVSRAVAEQPGAGSAKPAPKVVSSREHTRGLLLIGLFKLCKATLAMLSGFAAYHLTQVDPGELAMQLVSFLRIDPVGRLATAIMDQADAVSSHGLRQLGALSFFLALLYVVEGGGLMLQKVWAEYFTVVMTAGAMPFEIHELLEKYTDVKLAVLLVNAAVVIYLAFLLREKRRRTTECA